MTENKVKYTMFPESIRRNSPNFVIDHEPETLLTCESPFSIAFKKFSGKKTELVYKKINSLCCNEKINMGFYPVSHKEDSTVQYVPKELTSRAILRYEDVLANILQQNENNNGVYKSFRYVAAYKNNLFPNSTPNGLKLCIYHDDFSIVNLCICVIEFVQIVEIFCCNEFTNIDLLLLQGKINTFFPKYIDFFPNVIMKSNSHFFRQYPAMIRKFGPLIKTRRFESKNGYFKSTF